MSKRSVLIFLLVTIITVTNTGCSIAINKGLISNEQLRESYKAVAGFENATWIRPFSLNETFQSSTAIIMASPQGEPIDFLNPTVDDSSITVEYKTVKMEIIKVLKGQLSENVINVSVPVINGAFMDMLKQGENYIMCIAPADYVGKDQWGTATEMVFYVSESNQIVPMIDDEEHNKVMGITFESFIEVIEKANAVQ